MTKTEKIKRLQNFILEQNIELPSQAKHLAVFSELYSTYAMSRAENSELTQEEAIQLQN